MNLTIFAVPKAFENLFAIIQINAIKSWTQIRPRPQIILFGNDQGTAEIARELGTDFIPEIQRNEFGTPLLNDIFEKVEKEASNSILCYVNCDIILPTDFSEVVAKIPFQRFLMVGQRWDLDLNTKLDFGDSDWEKKLNERRKIEATLHPVTGIDYFIYRRGCFKEIPPFAVGRPMWDNWMIFNGRLLKIPVIDATQALPVIHQNHGYGSPERLTLLRTGPEAKNNRELAGGYSCAFDVTDANYFLLPGGWKRRRLTKARINQELFLSMKRNPKAAIFFRLLQKLLDPPGLWDSIRIRLKAHISGWCE